MPNTRWLLFTTLAVLMLSAANPFPCAAEDKDAGAASQTAAAPDGCRTGPKVQLTNAEQPPTMDGKLDDACWENAVVFDQFYCPDYDGPPPEKTTVRITADRKALYVGVTCDDRTPADIIAAETRRNGDIWNEDFVAVSVDPSSQHREFYRFRVTPRGTQHEDIPGGSATKIEWRGDWSAAACQTDTGWTAELAVPFDILRCPPGQHTMTFGITRQFGKERVSSVWPNTGKTYDASLYATLLGIDPLVEPKRTVWMPYVTADVGDAADPGLDAGLDVQHKLPNGLTALGAFNPDFKQIEDVVEPIAFSYTERYLSDPRPFFVTGQDGYLPREHLLYTRRISDFDAGLKLFGTVGNETIGFLDAVRFGDENALAAAWRHRFDDDNGAKLLLVSHRQDGEPDNLAWGIDAWHTWRQPDGKGRDEIWSVLYFSRDGDIGSGSSLLIGGTHNHGLGKIQYDWYVKRVTPDFLPALGYYPDVNNIGGTVSMQQTWLYEHGPMYGRQWMLSADYYPYLEGDGMLQSKIAPGYAWLTRGGQLWVVIVERAKSYDFDSSDAMIIHSWRDGDTYHRGEANLVRGKRAGGDYTYLRISQRLKPAAKLCLNIEGERTRLDMPDPAESGTDYQAIVTASYDITCEKSVAARTIYNRTNGTNVYLAYRQVVRKGMDAYVILGDPDPDRSGFSKRAVLKLIWAF